MVTTKEKLTISTQEIKKKNQSVPPREIISSQRKPERNKKITKE